MVPRYDSKHSARPRHATAGVGHHRQAPPSQVPASDGVHRASGSSRAVFRLKALVGVVAALTVTSVIGFVSSAPDTAGAADTSTISLSPVAVNPGARHVTTASHTAGQPPRE